MLWFTTGNSHPIHRSSSHACVCLFLFCWISNVNSFIRDSALYFHRHTISKLNMNSSQKTLISNNPKETPLHDNETKQILRVAIIGGGVAGLSCASHLKTLSQSSSSSSSIQFQPVVFDTGRLRPGGRCSSRYPKDTPKNRNHALPLALKQSIVDHAAQILSVPTMSPSGNPMEWKAFQDQLQTWETQGIIQKFPPYSIGRIRQSSSTTRPSPSSSIPFDIQWLNGDDKKKGTTSPRSIYYYATQGMASIPQAILDSSRFHMEQNVWISPSNGLEFINATSSSSTTNNNNNNNNSTNPRNHKSNQWLVRSSTKSYGYFDRVIIAHNGKCAYRLTSKTPAKILNQLLDTHFYYSVPAHGGSKMTLNSIYSLTIVVQVDKTKQSTSIIRQAMGSESLICAFIQNEPNLKFITCQSQKFVQSSSSSSQYEVWTVLSSPKVGKEYKAPQENIPQDIQSTVTHLLLSSLERCLHLESGSLTQGDNKSAVVVDSFLQLWGAAVPINTWKNKDIEITDATPNTHPWETNGFVYDAEYGIGACGDWLLDPSIAGAWESGRRLAQWMARMPLCEPSANVHEMKQQHSVGLNGKFQASKIAQESGIGNL